MSAGIALIDMGGTFTKLGWIPSDPSPSALEVGSLPAVSRFLSKLLWARADRLPARLAAEFDWLLKQAGQPRLQSPDGLKMFEKVYLSFAGWFKSGHDGVCDLAYVNHWHKEAMAPAGTEFTSRTMADLLGTDPHKTFALVDKYASGISFIARHPGRNGAVMTLGTGTGLIRVHDGHLFDDVTARTVLVNSDRERRDVNLHEFLGDPGLAVLAGGGSPNLRVSISNRILKSLLAVERRLVDASGAAGFLIEIAGGGFDACDWEWVCREFGNKRQADTSLAAVADPSFNNIFGLAHLCRTGTFPVDYYGN